MLKKHPYIAATIIATLLGTAVWLFAPKEYAAITKVSDEYREVELAVGLDRLSTHIRNLKGSQNTGVNDILVYSKLLLTDDFARKIAHKLIDEKGTTYGKYLNQKDTIEAVKDNILYNVSDLHQTLTIQFTDKNPVMASRMLDSVTTELQRTISTYRRNAENAKLKNAIKRRSEAAKAYHATERRYDAFVDAHFDANLQEVKSRIDGLQKEVDLAFKDYQETITQTVRQESLVKRTYCSFAVITANSLPQHPTKHILPYIFVFIFFALVMTKAKKLYRERRKQRVSLDWGGLFSPWMITILVWSGLAVLFAINGGTLDPLTSLFYNSIALWIPIFILTSFITYNLLEHKKVPMPTKGIEINERIFNVFFVISIVISPLYLYKVWQVVSMFDSEEMLNNVRLLAVYGEGMGFLNYTIVISQSLLLVALWRYPKIKGWKLGVIIACCMINSIALMEKGGFFLVVLCSLYVMFERGVIKLRTIIIIGALSIFLFYGFNLLRSGTDSNYAKDETLLDFIGMYIMSPPVAYCTAMQETGTQFGANTLEVLYLLLNRWGVGDFVVHSKVQEFVFVPISTNVYTIMQPFYRDFGYAGVAFFAWIYGLISGVLYRFSNNGNVVSICLYTYMVEVLVLQFYQENIFLSMVFVLQLVFFTFLYTQKKIKLSLLPTKANAGG